MVNPAHAREQRGQLRAIRIIHRREFHAQALTGFGMADDRFRANLTLGHEEMQACPEAFRELQGGFDKQTPAAQVADAR